MLERLQREQLCTISHVTTGIYPQSVIYHSFFNKLVATLFFENLNVFWRFEYHITNIVSDFLILILIVALADIR